MIFFFKYMEKIHTLSTYQKSMCRFHERTVIKGVPMHFWNQWRSFGSIGQVITCAGCHNLNFRIAPDPITSDKAVCHVINHILCHKGLINTALTLGSQYSDIMWSYKSRSHKLGFHKLEISAKYIFCVYEEVLPKFCFCRFIIGYKISHICLPDKVCWIDQHLQV